MPTVALEDLIAAGTVKGTAAINAAVAAGVAGLVNSSPAALDTLKELADAIGNDTTGKLAALVGATWAANKLPYLTGAAAVGLADLTAAGRALLDDADAPAQLTTLGVSTFVKTLLDDADAAAARATLGVSGGATAEVNAAGRIYAYATFR